MFFNAKKKNAWTDQGHNHQQKTFLFKVATISFVV